MDGTFSFLLKEWQGGYNNENYLTHLFYEKKYLVGGVALILIILGIWWFSEQGPEVITGVKKVEGDYTVNTDIVLKDGAKLDVSGTLTIEKEITCDGGGIEFAAGDGVRVNGTLLCNREDAGIIIVSKKDIEFGETAHVESTGGVQIAHVEEDIVRDEAKRDQLYDDVLVPTDGKPRIGPLTEAARANVRETAILDGKEYRTMPEGFRIIRTAHAQTPRDKEGNEIPNVIIGGTWRIGGGTPPPSGVDVPTPGKKIKKILLNFNFGPNGNAEFRNFHLVGPDGRDGEPDQGKSCNARGGKGEDAFRMRVAARNITIAKFRLELGSGGDGGPAETLKDCDPGIAKGGDGGEAGNFKMIAEEGIVIQSFEIVPGAGGSGGEAIAKGRDGKPMCPGEKGGDATATGGKGGDNKKELSATGAVTGISNVTIAEVIGGYGGDGIAEPGKGGDGSACGCNGGMGGKGTATGGNGGMATIKIQGGGGTAVGGDGGDADSVGGTGGNGGSCGPDRTGGNGGKGGDAKSKEGKAGKGTSSDGTDGAIRQEKGGDGGNGGDGCKEGKGGSGGKGNPNGAPGKDGKNLCIVPAKPGTAIDPGTKTDKKETTPSCPPDSFFDVFIELCVPKKTETTPPPQTKKIQAIQYQGKYLPRDQLIIENEAGCGADHWHAAQGIVISTDNSLVEDPGPQCGFGKVSSVPIIETFVPQAWQPAFPR